MATTDSTISPEVKLYYSERLRQLGISEKFNKIVSPVYIHDKKNNWTPTEEKKEKLAFEINANGIQINYFLPTGYPIDWKKDGTKFARNYIRTRLLKEKTYEKEGQILTQKYDQEKGSPVVPYLTPGIIEAFTTKKQIETLVLIEGEFKAFKTWLTKTEVPEMENWEFVGIPGIHGFYGGDTNHRREINEILQDIILTCKVKNIVLLTDADTLTVKWKEDKDLRNRQLSFASAVVNFRNALHLLIEDKTVELSQVYFMHLKTKFSETAKGIDDLLIQNEAKQKAILEDMMQLHFAKTYFDGIILSDGQTSGIYKYFGTNNEKDFYALYKEFINSRPFIFKKTKYEWTGEELKYVKSEESDRYARIGVNWIKRVRLPNHRNIIEERIEKWSVAEIKRDYPKHISDQMVNKDIPRYDGLFSMPNWDPKEYRRSIHGCYNLMEPLIWDPKPGKIDITLGFLKHLFQGEGNIVFDEKEGIYKETSFHGDQFTIALDWLSILHQYPTQKTFVPCLVSKDQSTGKSTFLDWLCMVYTGNGTILNNEQFKKNFNAHWASKFIIGLDEGFLDVEKKAERERLKQMVTAKEIFLELKGIDVKAIPYFGHLIICSNDADNLMKMEEEDTRWFVVKVKKADKKDPELEDKLKAEVPAWINFIANRKIIHPKVDRLWFDPKDFETEQMRKIIEVTKARLDAVVENWVKDTFLTYKVPSFRVGRKTMLRNLNDPNTSKYRIDEKELKYYMEEKRKMPYLSPGRCKFPININGFDNNNQAIIAYTEENQRHYYFKPEDWLNPQEYKEYTEPFEFSKFEAEDEQFRDKQTNVHAFETVGHLDNRQYSIEEQIAKREKPSF